VPTVKKCGTCREVKNTSEFVPRRDAPGKFMPRCKACRDLEKSNKRIVKQGVKQTMEPKREVSDYEKEFRRMRPKIIKRANGRCEAQIVQVCTGAGRHVHHRKLRKQGGTNGFDNLCALCTECHEWIHAHPSVSYSKGWLVHEWEPEVPLQPNW